MTGNFETSQTAAPTKEPRAEVQSAASKASPDAMTESADGAVRDLSPRKKRLQDISILFTILGILAFCTALPRIFSAMDGGGQVPQIGIVIFGFWFVLIVAAYCLSNGLLDDEDER